MIDVFNGALRAASMQNVWAAPLAFAAGAVSSIGPCVAPRFIAIAGLTAGKQRRQSAGALCGFIGGLVSAYAALGAAASLLVRAGAFSTALYDLLAVALIAGGIQTLLREPQSCEHASQPGNGAGFGAAFLLGACFAFIVSPCCTPIVAVIAAYSAASGNVLFGAGILACFAAGHAVPLALTGVCAERLSTLLARSNLQRAARTAGGGLMLAVGAYYAVLA